MVLVLLTLCITAFSSVFALSSELETLHTGIENDIKTWQITSASTSINQALEISETDEDKYRTYYLKSLIDFYNGNYTDAKEYGQKALDSNVLEDETPLLNFIVKASNDAPEFSEVSIRTLYNPICTS